MALSTWSAMAGAAVLLVGCALPQFGRDPARSTLQCGEHRLGARIDDDVLQLTEGPRLFRLTKVRTASGSKYEASGDAWTFVWFKGRHATVSLAGQPYPDCAVDTADAPAPPS